MAVDAHDAASRPSAARLSGVRRRRAAHEPRRAQVREAREDDGGVAGFQRARMIAALVEVVGERGGVGELTVADIVARAGISRRTFYELFADREACLLAAFDEAVRRALARVSPAFVVTARWRERMRGALGALLEFLEDEPGYGRLCIVDVLGAGPEVLVHR